MTASYLRLTPLICLLCFLGVPESAATEGSQFPRVGWVYRLEGHLEGQPVIYVGSAADLKVRLRKGHKWFSLLQKADTRVYAMEVFAALDVPASNQQSLRSARIEALRAAEQRVLSQMREQVERNNRTLPPGEKATRLLNIDEAATAPATWEARHKVATSNTWQQFERHTSNVSNKAFVAMTLLDAYIMYRDTKRARYVMAPYVLGDEQGFFTRARRRQTLLPTQHYKCYFKGSAEGQQVPISASEFNDLQEEAEALWGTTDWLGDFVPGLLNRELPILPEQNAVHMR